MFPVYQKRGRIVSLSYSCSLNLEDSNWTRTYIATNILGIGKQYKLEVSEISRGSKLEMDTHLYLIGELAHSPKLP